MFRFSNQTGMTIIELMVVIAILGILASIAYPSYQDTIRSSRRAEAKTSIMAIQSAMEKMRANCGKYATASASSLSAASLTLTDACTKSTTVNISGEHYQYSVTGGGMTDYKIIASGASSSQKDDGSCVTMSITRDGTQSPSTGCW